MIGEVKKPLLAAEEDIEDLTVPWDFLRSTDLSSVSEQCKNSDKFMLSGVTARPFERLQFLRGTENLFKDIIRNGDLVEELLSKIHKYNLKHIETWLETDVDGIFLMDDWGSQNSLLISPQKWEELFKPLYREYCDLIHDADKYAFFHSDGNIEEIYDDLIEVGIDALNSQLFCMDIEKLSRKYAGEITFWGEIDRQTILPFGTTEEVENAVERIKSVLSRPEGGIIAQCSWQKNVPPENVKKVFETWSEF